MEEQRALDSDDPEYQSVFAALNELALSSLKPCFKEKCFRDKTLSFVEEKEELKGILKKELELPFGQTFEFSRLWFKKYHGKDSDTKKEEKGALDSDDPEYQSVFATLNELALSSLKPLFKQKCFRDKTLSFIEEKEELKVILQEELELPFGQAFEFSRLWFTKNNEKEEEAPNLPAVQRKQSKRNRQEAEEPSFEAAKEWPAKCKHDIQKQVGQEAILDQLEMVPSVTEQSYAYFNVKDSVNQRDVSDMTTTKTTTQNECPVRGQLVETTKQGKPPSRSVMLKDDHSNAMEDEFNLENADTLQQEENNEPLADHSGHSAENTLKQGIIYVPLEATPSQDYNPPPPENNDEDNVVKTDNSDQQQETVSSAYEKEREGGERPQGDANQTVNQLSHSRSKSKKKKKKKSSTGTTSNASTEGIAESKMEKKEEKKGKVSLEGHTSTEVVAAEATSASDSVTLPFNKVAPSTIPPQNSFWEDRTSLKDNIEPAAKEKEECSTNAAQDDVPLLSTASWNTPKPEKAFSNQDGKRNLDEKLESKETILGNGTLDGKKIFPNFKRCTPRSRGVEGRLVSYEKGCVLDAEENREVEFKSLVNAYPSSLPWKIMEKAKKFICACLNAKRKGIIYFGVGDNQEEGSKYQHGEILGLDVDTLKDDINKALQSLLNDHIKSDAGPLQKGGEQNCVSIYYVPVTENGYRSNLYVVEIEVIRDWGFCRDHIYYSKSWTAKRGGDKDFAGKKALNDFYKVKDEFDEVAIRTNGASCCVKQVDVDRDVKKPLEVKYKEWRQTTKKDAREIPDELGLEEADVRRLSIAVRKRLCELNRKEYGYVLVANKVPAKYRGTTHLSFLQNIPCVAVFDLFDPSSKQNGLHFACNEMTDAPRANIRTLDDFKDVIPDKDSFVSIRGTTWILSNADMQNEGWIKCSKDCMWRALSAYKQCFSPGRLLFIFLIFSETAVEEMADIVECSFSILGNAANNCVTILSEGKPAAEAIINASKLSLRKELAGCSISGITWSLLKEIVREMVGPSKFEERGATTDLPYYNGKLKEVPIKTVLSWDDLEVYCPNPRLPTSAESIAKERDAFYKGAQASQMNLYHEHSIPRSLEGKVNTKLEKALNSLSKESIDANYYVKTVTLSYEPGSGATTFCRRIIWGKRNEYRCALVKSITQSTDFQIEKLHNIGYDEMNKIYSLPVLVLVDNFPESDVRFLTEHITKRQTKCVLLTTLPISKSVSNSEFEITLGKLDEKETSLVKDILITITDDSGRRLEAEKVLERERRFIWFGLELFGRDYLKIKERLQNHIHSILTTLRNDSRGEPQMLLDMCCFLNRYSDGSIILPNALVLDFLYERNSFEQQSIQEVHDMFGGILLEEQNETHGYYGWRPAHSLVSEVVTSRISAVDSARLSLEIICKGKAYVVKFLSRQVFRMFLERKRLSDPVFLEEQAVDDRAGGFDIENEIFGFHGKRTRYSPVIVDILDKESNVEGALSVLLEICKQATQTEDKAYAWQQLARFMGYEMRAIDMNKQSDLLKRLHSAMMKETRVELPTPESGIDAAHTAVDIAVSLQPKFTNHYTTKGVLYLLQLRDLKTLQSRSVPKGIEICRKALSVYDKALEASREPNHFSMNGKLQAIISLLEIVKDLPCFQPDGIMFMAYLKKEKVPREMQEVLSNEEQDYVQSLSRTTLDILNELFGNIKLKQTTTYDENEIRSLNNAKIRASNLRRKFYEITKFDKMELANEEYSMSLSSTTNQDLTLYQQKVQDILFIRDETPYSTWSNLTNSDVDRIYQMLKFLCFRGRGSHNDMLICSKACLHLKDKPPVQDLDDLVSLWVKNFPNSEWAHLFYYMIHFPVPNGSLAPFTASVKESIKRCSKIVQEKAGSGFRKSGAEYFLGKGRGLDAIISGHEFQKLQTKWKTKTEFWRGREPTERLERVQGQKDLGSKGIISYQGIQLHFDNTLYPNESKDDLWFYVGFTFAGPYAYDPVDNDTYMSLTNGNHATLRKVRSSKYSTPPRGLQERASAREHEVDRNTRDTNRSSEFLQKTPLYARDRDKDEKNDWFVVGGRFGPLCESAEKPSKEENKLTRFPHRPENRTSRDRFEAKRSEPNLRNVKTIVGTRGTEKKHFNLTSTAPDGKVHHGAYVCGANKSTECIKHTSWKDDSFTDWCNFAHSWKGDTLQFVCTKCTESKLSFCKEKVKHQEFIWNLGPYYNRYGEFWKRTSPRPIGNTASFDSGGSASSRERTPPLVREKPMSWGSRDWSEQFSDSGRIDWFDD